MPDAVGSRNFLDGTILLYRLSANVNARASTTSRGDPVAITTRIIINLYSFQIAVKKQTRFFTQPVHRLIDMDARGGPLDRCAGTRPLSDTRHNR